MEGVRARDPSRDVVGLGVNKAASDFGHLTQVLSIRAGSQRKRVVVGYFKKARAERMNVCGST